MVTGRTAVSYTDAELEAMMIDLESDLVERKESAQDGRKIRRNVCAFANDLPGNGKPGVLLVGVCDDGACASLTVDDDLLTSLANIPGEGQVLPLPSLTVQKRVLRGCEVVVVTVSPSAEPPVRYRGRVWVRVEASVREASVADERRLGERRRARDLPFDARPAEGASLGALDVDYVRNHYLPSAMLKHFRSLMPLAQEARKPMFKLKPADGTIGGHTRAVSDCYDDFRALAREVARRCDIPQPSP